MDKKWGHIILSFIWTKLSKSYKSMLVWLKQIAVFDWQE